GVAGWVLKNGETLILDDVRDEPRFVKAEGLSNRVRSLICFPVRESGQVVGVFNISHFQKGFFNEVDKLALGYVANQLSAALTSARFFLEIQKMNPLKKGNSELWISRREPLIPDQDVSTFIEINELILEKERYIYASEKMQRIKEMVDQVANTDVTVLIQGESGVGKEVIARSIHLNSCRKDKPFVKVNCAALPSELLESELFGYEKGAFTGAYRQKPGKFEQANGGTIFLDEISEMSPSLQSKLLQVLQDREFSRLGSNKDIRVDVRVLVSTNRDPEKAVKEGRLREDLYYRLNVVNILIPPLRERREEIPIFVNYFLDRFSRKYHKTVKPLSEKVLRLINHHPWIGNVRELENMIQRYVILGDEKMIVDEIAPGGKKDFLVELERKEKKIIPQRVRPSLKEVHREALKKAESEIIFKALEMTNWNRKKAARQLNIIYKALLYKIKEIELSKKSFPPPL
ncbi:MAG: sigma 54-interacting transcriptional regulator, partial [Thermodesulfobacteriota bacterium]